MGLTGPYVPRIKGYTLHLKDRGHGYPVDMWKIARISVIARSRGERGHDIHVVFYPSGPRLVPALFVGNVPREQPVLSRRRLRYAARVAEELTNCPVPALTTIAVMDLRDLAKADTPREMSRWIDAHFDPNL